MHRLKESDAVVESLGRCIHHGTVNIELVPELVKRLISEDLWQVREPASLPGRHEEFDTFAEFCQAEAPIGLGCSIETLNKLCKDDAEALKLIRDVTVRANHRPKSNDNIISSSADQGTSKSYTLQRLERERRDLYELVVSGDLSANAAAIEAGFRTKTITVPLDVERAAKSLRKHFGDDLPKLVDALT